MRVFFSAHLSCHVWPGPFLITASHFGLALASGAPKIEHVHLFATKLLSFLCSCSTFSLSLCSLSRFAFSSFSCYAFLSLSLLLCRFAVSIALDATGPPGAARLQRAKRGRVSDISFAFSIYLDFAGPRGRNLALSLSASSAKDTCIRMISFPMQ